MKKSSMKFSAAFSKFMFYFGNIIIGIIFVSSLIWMISASLKPEALIFANMNSIKTFFPASAFLSDLVHCHIMYRYFSALISSGRVS